MCKPEICGICQHKSWTGCGEHIGLVMDTTPRENWCKCSSFDDDDDTKYPPKAGTGYRK